MSHVTHVKIPEVQARRKLVRPAPFVTDTSAPACNVTYVSHELPEHEYVRPA